MSTFEVRATASHRYYMNKSKDEIVSRIFMMKQSLQRLWCAYPMQADWSRCSLMTQRKHDLASLAMKMHDCFPDNP